METNDTAGERTQETDGQHGDRRVRYALGANEAVRNGPRSVICTTAVSKQLSFMIVWVLCGLFVSIILYHGTFLIWDYPLSDLGAQLTVSDKLNVVTRIVFDLTMTLSGILMIRIFALLSNDIRVRHGRIKAWMTFVCAAGFFMLLMPYDVNLAIHEIGASLVFGMLWGLTIMFSLELKSVGHWKRALASQVVLQGSVLPYAFLFAVGIPAEVAAQKIAVVGLMVAVWLATRRP